MKPEFESETKIRDLFEQEWELIYKESSIDENRGDPMILNDAWVVNLRMNEVRQERIL